MMQQNGLAAHRSRADNSAVRKRVKRIESADQRVTTVLARQHSGNHCAISEMCLHILHRMNGGVAVAVQKTPLKLLDEQPLATGIGKRPVKDLVPSCSQRENLASQRLRRAWTSSACAMASAEARLASTSGLAVNISPSGMTGSVPADSVIGAVLKPGHAACKAESSHVASPYPGPYHCGANSLCSAHWHARNDSRQ